MIGVRLSAVDTLFFRDGTPFTPEGTAQASVGGLFPPSPDSVSGAVRAALGRLNHCDLPPPQVNGRRTESPNERVERLRRLRFEAPYLLDGDTPLIPVPRHILGTSEGDKWQPRALLAPGTPVTCDLGDEVRLPEVVRNDRGVPLTELKQAEGYWMRFDDLAPVLRGELPEEKKELVPQRCLWRTEQRTGLERSSSTRTATKGMLYNARHVRPKDNVSLGVRIQGVPSDWRLPFEMLIPLGGEGRFAECVPWDDQAVTGLEMPLREAVASGRAMLIALTPLILSSAVCRGEEPLTELGEVRVVSACLDRPARIGGWNSLKRRPRPMRSVLPAGSVLFCEGLSSRSLEMLPRAEGALPQVGELTEYGYGVVAIGLWPKAKGEEGVS